MAPDIAKVDADRHLNLGLPAWNFSDEVLPWLLHGNSLSPLQKTCSSHLSLLLHELLVSASKMGPFRLFRWQNTGYTITLDHLI